MGIFEALSVQSCDESTGAFSHQSDMRPACEMWAGLMFMNSVLHACKWWQSSKRGTRLSHLANPYHMSGEAFTILGRQSYDDMICMHRLEFKRHHFFLPQKQVQLCVPLLPALFQINLSYSPQMNFSWRTCMLYSIRKLDSSIAMDVWLAHLTYLLQECCQLGLNGTISNTKRIWLSNVLLHLTQQAFYGGKTPSKCTWLYLKIQLRDANNSSLCL